MQQSPEEGQLARRFENMNNPLLNFYARAISTNTRALLLRSYDLIDCHVSYCSSIDNQVRTPITSFQRGQAKLPRGH